VGAPTDDEATRAAYDIVAHDYADLFRGHLDTSICDRAVLGSFAELVLAAGGGPVIDLGCGPGRITGPLHDQGLDVRGIDLSPAMVEVARRDFPHLSFECGSMRAIAAPDEALAGAVAWYSIIHTPPDDQPELFHEMARVLRNGGQLLAAFQVGDTKVHLTEVYGHDDLSFDVYRLDPVAVSEQLVAAGFAITATLTRAAREPEQHPQCYLFATIDR
jgi:SAM-dependent methyltransferase